ncbi:TRAP transporter small permease [Oricola thermophila]|uniref:TRAP transporter small permease protein n=1 Tax=Oricola thermophila TaxID=2742145 RepID=A0A6N1VDE6_9HYPH|nr:TRAP transporter small permease [Oricola thermophila]QKV18553.1 TRAP transporter small permease [Oricola thermophila]
MLRLALGVGMVILFASVIVQVIGRYVFAYTPPWSEVTAALTLTWLTFLGAALAVRGDENLAVTLLPDRLRGCARIAVTIFIAFCGGLFAWVLISAGYDQMAIVSRARIIGLDLSAAWLYASAPVAAIFMLIFHLETALRAVTPCAGDGK